MLASRQGHHMGNVLKPGLSLHLRFFFGLFVFQPAAASVGSSFHLSVGQNNARQVRYMARRDEWSELRLMGSKYTHLDSDNALEAER